jgi:hypothetical protein
MKFFKGFFISLPIALVLWLIIIQVCFGATYYMREDGTAANKAAASSCDAAATSMSVATHNAETFTAGDIIYVCNSGGTYSTTTWNLPSSGTVGVPIRYIGSGGPILAIPTGQIVGFGNNGHSYFEIDNLIFRNTLNVNGFQVLLSGNVAGVKFTGCLFDYGADTDIKTSVVFSDVSTSATAQFEKNSFVNTGGGHNICFNVADTVTGILNLTVYTNVFQLFNIGIISYYPINLDLRNNTFIGATGQCVHIGTSSPQIKIVNNLFDMTPENSKIAVYFTDAAAATIVADPAKLEIDHNGFWRDGGGLANDLRLFVFMGATNQYYFPLPITNYYLDPKFSGPGFAIQAGSYLAMRGDAAELPTSQDNSYVDWSGAHIGAYSNPAITANTITTNKAALHGDSIAYGFGASDDAHAAPAMFQTLTGLTTATNLYASYPGAGVVDGFWMIDQLMTVEHPQIVFSDMGANNVFWGMNPSLATYDNMANMQKLTFDKAKAWGATKVYWTGLTSDQGNPPDNTERDALQAAMETMCESEGISYDNLLGRYKFRSDWATHDVYYHCLDGDGCDIDPHPNDAGHLSIASVMENLYNGRYTYWLADANIGSLQAGTYQHPITAAQFNAITTLPTGSSGHTVSAKGVISSAVDTPSSGASGKVLTMKNIKTTKGLTIDQTYWDAHYCIATNDGGAALTISGTNVNVYNGTFAYASGNGITASETCTIKNTVSYGNTGDDLNIASDKIVSGTNNLFGDSAKAGSGTYTDVAGTQWSINPKFKSATDYHLIPGSPAINAGMTTGVTEDFDGKSVPYSSATDIGAHEYIPTQVHR